MSDWDDAPAERRTPRRSFCRAVCFLRPGRRSRTPLKRAVSQSPTYLDALARTLVAENGAMPLVEDPRRLKPSGVAYPAA